jgi:hypothetical protein
MRFKSTGLCFIILLLFLLSPSAYTQKAQPMLPEVEAAIGELGFFQRIKVKRAVNKQLKFQEKFRDSFDYFLPVPVPVPSTAIQSQPWHVIYTETLGKDQVMLDLIKTKGAFFLLDTGVPENPKLLEAAHPGHIPENHTSDPTVIDGHSHSSHIAGEWAYRDQVRQTGVLPVLFESDNMYICYEKVCTDRGGCNTDWIINAIDKSISYYKAKFKPAGIPAIISLSLGGGSFNAAFEKAIIRAVEAGMIVVCSSGNNGRNIISYPANYNAAIAVGAHDQAGKKASFSNWDEKEGLFAVGPGVNIISTGAGKNKFVTFSGTSMGNPLFNWIFLYVKMCRPDWDWSQVIDFVADNTFDLGPSGYDNQTGNGTVKFDKFVQALKSGEEPEPPTCDDGKKNGDEEGVDCGGANCPPCEPDNPEPCAKRLNTHTVKYVFGPEENWSTRWKTISGTFTNGSYVLDGVEAMCIDPEDAQPDVLSRYGVYNINSFRRVNIKELRVSFETDWKSPCAKSEVRKALADYFDRYVLLLSDNSDYTDAGKFTVYFADMMANRNFNIDVEMKYTAVTGINDELVYWEEKDIRKWPVTRDAPDSYFDTNTTEWIVEVLWLKTSTINPPALPYVDEDSDFTTTTFRYLQTKYSAVPDKLKVFENDRVFKESKPGEGFIPLKVVNAYRIRS